MDESTRTDLIQMGWEIHGVVEESYRSHPATREDEAGWLDKRRLLLPHADLKRATGKIVGKLTPLMPAE